MSTSAKYSSDETETLYVPVGNLKRASYRHLKIARLQAPDQECGKAQRIGYIQCQGQLLALYRLKIQSADTANLRKMHPGFFILEQKVFRSYKKEVLDA